MTLRHELTLTETAIENLLAMPTALFQPVLVFLKHDDRGRRANCLAKHPALAAHLAIAGGFHPSAAFNAKYDLDCGYELERVAKTARLKLPVNTDVSKLRIEWRGKRPWIAGEATVAMYQPRPPLIDAKEVTRELEMARGSR